jgi:hypothetical protein
MRRLPGPADDGLSDGGNSRGSLRFVSGLAENTNSIFCADSSESQTANGCLTLFTTHSCNSLQNQHLTGYWMVVDFSKATTGATSGFFLPSKMSFIASVASSRIASTKCE